MVSAPRALKSNAMKLALNKRAFSRNRNISKPILLKGARNKAVKVTVKGSKPPEVKSKGTIKSKFDLMIPVFQKSTQIEPDVLAMYLHKTVEVHNKFIENLGVQFGTKHFKSIANYCVLLCEGRKPEPVARVSVGSKDKWPKCFGFLRPLYHDIVDNIKDDPTASAEKLRLLMTLFKLNKVCSDYSEIDITNIALSFNLPSDTEEEFIEYLSDRLGETQDIETNDFNIRPFMGSSNGPNGLPKIESAMSEAAALYQSKQHVHFRTMCEITDNMPFYRYFEHCAKTFIEENPDFDLKDVKLRKLIAVPDSGNKSRTVAIVDFWTQTVLAPLEADLQSRLKKDFQKSTAYFSHSDGFNEIKEKWTKDIVSIDAEAWTDNFPARLQYLTLRQLYGQQFAVAWQSLAVKCPWYVGNSSKTIIYGKGQGMGTKGSFMAASYCDHHFIEFTYLKEYNEVLFYKKVGDDLIVTDPRRVFSDQYSKIGVPINSSKSKVSTKHGHFVEFVSRNALNGVDYSTLSAKLLTKTAKQPYLLVTLIRHLRERLPESFIPTLGQVLEQMSAGKTNRPSYEAHRARINLLISLYQEFSGDNIVVIDENPNFNNYHKFVMAIILKIAEYHSSKQFVPEDPENERAGDLITGFTNGEFDCEWTYYLESNMNLHDVKLFSYALQLNRKIEAIAYSKAADGGIHNINFSGKLGPTKYVQLPKGDNGFPYRQKLLSLLMNVLMETKCNALGIKILKSLDTVHPKNARPIVELFRDLNKLVEVAETREDWSLSLRDTLILREVGLLRFYRFLLNPPTPELSE